MAVNFGSAAAELAVCVSAVGLVDRSDLSALALEAPVPQLDALMRRLAGATVSPGGLICTGSAWWCGQAADRVLVLCDPRAGRRIGEGLRAEATRHVTVRELSDDLTAIALLGRHTNQVLNALGAFGASGDPRAVPPFARGSLDGIEAWWLLQSDRRAMTLVPRERAGEAWLAIERAGRAFGISCVGHEAACRYALLERARPVAVPFD